MNEYKLPSLMVVEGFNPEYFLKEAYDAVDKKTVLYLPLQVKKTWFRLKFPKGKIVSTVTEENDKYIIAECKVYETCTDSEDSYIASSCSYEIIRESLVRELNLTKEELVPFTRLTALGKAEAKALRNAGFGLTLETTIDMDESIASNPLFQKCKTKPNMADGTKVHGEQKKVVDKALSASNTAEADGNIRAGQSFVPSPTTPTDAPIKTFSGAESPLSRRNMIPAATPKEDTKQIKTEAVKRDAFVDQNAQEVKQNEVETKKPTRENESDTPVNSIKQTNMTLEDAYNVICMHDSPLVSGKSFKEIFNENPACIIWLVQAGANELEKTAAKLICNSHEELKKKLERVTF